MQSWRKNLYTTWFTQFLSLLGFGFGLPFIPFYIQELGVTDPHALKIWTGWLSSAPALMLGIMAPVWGMLADRIGKKLILMRAMIGGTIVLAGLGCVQSVYGVLIFRLLQGLLCGTVTSSAALVASGTPDKNLSYALGFIASSTSVGWALGPAVGGLIADIFGYRLSFFIGSGIIFAGMFLVLFFIKEPTPEMAGRSTENGKKDKPQTVSEKTRIITPALIMLLLLFFFVRITRFLPTSFLPILLQEIRGTLEGTSRVTGILAGAIGLMTALSGLTLTRLGDKRDRLKLMSVLIGSGAITASLVPIFKGFSILVISQLITYFLIGGVEPIIMSMTSEKVNSKDRGLLFGIQTAVGSSAWFLSPLLAGFISIKWSTITVFLFFAILLGITWLISLAVRKRI